jgi:hypothetical protein
MTTTTPNASVEDILYALQYADNEGTALDDWTYKTIAEDRAKRLEAAATLITLDRAAHNRVQDGYRGGDAVFELTDHIIEFDKEHGTTRGPVPADDPHWNVPGGTEAYVLQEWDAANTATAAA